MSARLSWLELALFSDSAGELERELLVKEVSKPPKVLPLPPLESLNNVELILFITIKVIGFNIKIRKQPRKRK